LLLPLAAALMDLGRLDEAEDALARAGRANPVPPGLEQLRQRLAREAGR
jgi:cytochrome c-type biogenesis protein CcmH/NrfG